MPYLLQLGAGIRTGGPREGAHPEAASTSSKAPTKCQEGCASLIKILHLPSAFPTTASALLIDQETFREEKAKQGICYVPVAIRDDCL